jgi:deoxyribonuclease (pyrimidine dimer)
MTRINIGVPTIALSDEHLLSEYRELPRVIKLAEKSFTSLTRDKFYEAIPQQFCMGTGHVKFFYNKLAFLHNRFAEITSHLVMRRKFALDYNIIDSVMFSFTNCPNELYNDYTPTTQDMQLIYNRLKEKVNTQKLNRFRMSLSSEQLEELLYKTIRVQGYEITR